MPYQAVVALVTWLVFYGCVAAVLVVSDRRARAKRQGDPAVDGFAETRPHKYLAVAVCLGGLVLPVYFYAARRSLRGGLIGLGWLVATTAFVSVFHVGAMQVGRALAPAAPEVSIWSPNDGEVLAPGLNSFFAAVKDNQDGSLPEDHVVWTSDKSGEIARGHSFIATLPPGTHHLTVVATDSDGNATKASVTVTVRAP